MARFFETLFETNRWGLMNVQEFPVSGLKLLTLKSYPDERGFFCERFKQSYFQENKFPGPVPIPFVQDNFSRSKARVLRGLHYQWDRPQGKLVTCLAGNIMDVAVDLRVSSKTFGMITQVELSGENPQWFWIPAGFAHGFCVLGEADADILYKCDQEYNSAGESGIRFDDAELDVKWAVANPIVSERDRKMASFQDYKRSPRFQ